MSIPCGSCSEDAKPDARKALIRWRAALTPDERALRSAAIADRVERRLAAYCADVRFGGQRNQRPRLAVFWPIRAEPDFRSKYPKWVALGYQLALPVTPPKPGPLTFCEWQPGEAMMSDSMGIQVPVHRRGLMPDIMIIPCLGYGDNGLRLGYGGGYYDRTLRCFSGTTIGVAYAGAYLPGLMREPHDCLLDEIVTDQTPR